MFKYSLWIEINICSFDEFSIRISIKFLLLSIVNLLLIELIEERLVEFEL